MNRWAAMVAMALCLAAGPAGAQDEEPADERTEQARALFTAGRVAFERNEYADALRHFREAHVLSGRPALLYNIGVAADRLRRDVEALEAFERYLREVGEGAPQRGDAEVRVRVLREQLAQGRRPDSSGSSGTNTTSDGVMGWGILGAGAAVLVTGVVFLGVGQAEADAYEGAAEGTPWGDVAGAHERADWMRVTGWVLAGVGLAAAVGGIVLALVPSSPSESVALHLRPSGLALVWRHR